MAFPPGNVLPEATRAAIRASNHRRKGKPCSEQGRANIALGHQSRTYRWPGIDFAKLGLDEPMIEMRRLGMSWAKVAVSIGCCPQTCRKRMRALVARGDVLAVLAPMYAGKRASPRR